MCVFVVVRFLVVFVFFFFKQKTAYEMRISDWSSDVCSSDLRLRVPPYRLPAVEIAAQPRDILGWRSAAAIFAEIDAGAETLAIAPYADHGRAFAGQPLERGRKGLEQRCGKGVRCIGPIKDDPVDVRSGLDAQRRPFGHLNRRVQRD